MTTRDPRSRDFPTPELAAGDVGRERTQDLDLDARGEPDAPGDRSPDALAFGTHNRGGTRVESPNGRARGEPPERRRARTAPPPGRRDDDPDDYQGAVLGSYRVLELLGKGGMGYVYRAEHVKLGREVALKLLRRDYASRRDAVARFFQEARTVNRVRHRNIVDVTDFVELADGTTYIIMELLTGTSLGIWARSGVALPRAVAALIQICDGLGAAHQVGVVHRDLKPDNVIVVPAGDGAELVKLLDFGVAKLLNRDDEDVGFETAAGSVIGTPAYMSPEQAGGMLVDARSDIYSLGAIMYELFCGQPMFRGRSFGEYVRKHLTEIPVAPRNTAGGAAIDRALEAVILRCLEKDPEQRFAHIFELRDALRGLLGHIDSRPPAPVHPIAGASSSLPQLAMQATMLPMHGAPQLLARPRSYGQPAPSGSGRLPISGATGLAASHAAQLPAAQLPASHASASHASASHASASHASASHASASHASASQLSASQLSASQLSASQLSASHASQLSASQLSASQLSASHASAPATPTTRWWTWAVGGAVAVAVGVGAAVWYPRRGESSAARQPPAVTQPPAATQPPAPPAPAAANTAANPATTNPAATNPAAARIVALRVDSLPAGGVFPEGSATALCRTPCTVNVDLADGGPADRRSFVVKRPGYLDGVVTVDLGGAARAFRIVLEPAPVVAEPAHVGATTTAKPERRPIKRVAKPRRDPQAPPAKPAPPSAPALDRLSDPSDGLPAAPKKPPAPAPIDPADTLDPFRNPTR